MLRSWYFNCFSPLTGWNGSKAVVPAQHRVPATPPDSREARSAGGETGKIEKDGGEENDTGSWQFETWCFFIWRTSWCSIVSYETFRGVPSILHVPHGNCDNLFPRSFHFQYISSVFYISTLTKQLKWFHASKLRRHIHTHIYVCEPKLEISWEITVPGKEGFMKSEVFPCEHFLQNPHSPYAPTSLSVTEAKPPGKCHWFLYLLTCQQETWDMTKIEWPPWKFNQPWFRRLLERHLQVQEKDTHVQNS